MKKLLAFLLALCLCFSLCACGESKGRDRDDDDDPNLGKYYGVQGEMDGFVMSMEELYPGESYLELKSGGKAVLVLEGDKIRGTWTVDDEEFMLEVDGEECPGTLEDGVIVIDFAQSGMLLTFAKKGANASSGDTPGGEPEDAGITGTYQLYALEQEGEYIDHETVTSVGLDQEFSITFNADGTAVLCIEGEEFACTYDDSTIVDSDGEMIEYAFTDGMLELYMEDEMIFYCSKGGETAGKKPGKNTASDGPLGLYEGTTYQYGEQTFEMSAIYEGLCTIELMEDGEAVFILGGEEMKCTWTLDGEAFILSNQGMESPGTLDDGVIVIDFMELGMIMTFVKG